MHYIDIIKSTIKDKKIIEAFEKIKREDFLPEEVKKYAHIDEPIPIGYGQTTSQPSLIAYMLEQLELKKYHKVLEIGAGCGFLTAILSYLAKEVIAIEIIPELYEFAKNNLKKYPFTKNVKLILGSGYFGYPEEAPYDRIIVSASPPEIPKEIIEQLKESGICIMPVGNLSQKLIKIKKNKEVEIKELLDVSFVPLVKK
jgi:protein-L-isoaspartate(D-aspartate) O-methyltransferase